MFRMKQDECVFVGFYLLEWGGECVERDIGCSWSCECGRIWPSLRRIQDVASHI